MTTTSHTNPAWRVEVFYDGECPICLREINLLRWLDGKHHRIRFTDIATATFNPADYGKTLAEFEAEIHGRLADGTWIIGVEVFRQLYSAVGFAFLMPITRLPIIESLLDWAYDIFARNRLRFTGRCKDDVCRQAR